MKYILMLLLVLTMGTGCSYESKEMVELEVQLIDLRDKSFFVAGEICAQCRDIKEHPENYKQGAWDKIKDTCEHYKDYETFKEAYGAGRIRE